MYKVIEKCRQNTKSLKRGGFKNLEDAKEMARFLTQALYERLLVRHSMVHKLEYNLTDGSGIWKTCIWCEDDGFEPWKKIEYIIIETK